MALHACKECGQEISSDAKVCPHCGKGARTAVPHFGCLSAVAVLLVVAYVGSKLENCSKGTTGAGGHEASEAPELPGIHQAMPAAAGNGNEHVAKPGGEPCLELDIANILLRPQSEAVRYFGRARKVLPPTEPGDWEWEYEYSGQNSTWGTKSRTLGLQYIFKIAPKDYDEALCKVGLSAEGPPSPVFRFTWRSRWGAGILPPPQGIGSGIVTFRGVALDQVTISEDLRQIGIWGEEAFASRSPDR